jgi:hypothetical protein
MPTPKDGESEKDFIARCIPIVLKEGTAKDQKQAAAICFSMYKKEKHFVDRLDLQAKTLSGVESSDWTKPPETDAKDSVRKLPCPTCKTDVVPTDENKCPDCGTLLVSEKKTLNISYAKSLDIGLSDKKLTDLLAVKFIGTDRIFHYPFLWGNSVKTDLEKEFFTKSTDFWDKTLGTNPRPLTWDHNQDESMKDNPVIGQTVEWGDDEIGRWAISHLDRAHRYRKAVDALIEEGVIGTSSDSAPQYVEREARGKSTYLKVWPWFASALTDIPCEPRMIAEGTVEYLKSIGVSFPSSEASAQQTRAMVDKAHRIFASVKMYIGD